MCFLGTTCDFGASREIAAAADRLGQVLLVPPLQEAEREQLLRSHLRANANANAAMPPALVAAQARD